MYIAFPSGANATTPVVAASSNGIVSSNFSAGGAPGRGHHPLDRAVGGILRASRTFMS
jgi:hypothetical protein